MIRQNTYGVLNLAKVQLYGIPVKSRKKKKVKKSLQKIELMSDVNESIPIVYGQSNGEVIIEPWDEELRAPTADIIS
jgi:hypothetical protein